MLLPRILAAKHEEAAKLRFHTEELGSVPCCVSSMLPARARLCLRAIMGMHVSIVPRASIQRGEPITDSNTSATVTYASPNMPPSPATHLRPNAQAGGMISSTSLSPSFAACLVREFPAALIVFDFVLDIHWNMPCMQEDG
jgi:hypothetical protein